MQLQWKRSISIGQSAIQTNILNNCTSKSAILKDDSISEQSKTYYRRQLPSSLTLFTSTKGRQLFAESMASGNAESYFSLVGNFTHQSEPAFCGLSSLTMVLNALEVDPKRQWKGVWRWYSEELLDCTSPLEKIKRHGIDFDEFQCLSKCNGLEITSKRADSVTKDEFINDLKTVTSSKDSHLVVSFSRKAMDQTGDGHFSPIGAFHSSNQQVLVLDTARFKYPSYFCSVDQLFNAMKPIDKATGKSRGYAILTKIQQNLLPIFKINLRVLDWSQFSHVLGYIIPSSLETNFSIDKVIHVILDILPLYAQPLTIREPGIDLAGAEWERNELENSVRDQVLCLINEIEQHPVYEAVKRVFANSKKIRDYYQNQAASRVLGIGLDGLPVSLFEPSIRLDLVLVTVFLLSAPNRMYHNVSPCISNEFKIQNAQILKLKDQLETILTTYCNCHNKSH